MSGPTIRPEPCDNAWREFAVCRGIDPDVFHPHPSDDDGEAAAKAICDQCPSRAACLGHAQRERESA